MYVYKMNLRNKRKYFLNSKEDINLIPDTWKDFASSCKIRSGQKIVKFIPYKYQVDLIDNIEKHKTTIIAKTRQLGITETITNYFLWKALRLDGYLAVIFSKTQSDTSNVAKRLRRQIESLNIKTKTDSLTDIEFFSGGRILFRNSTPNGARGLESVSDLLFDEAAFVDEIEEIYKSAIPCTTVVGDKAKVIILSTPNGQSGFFWDKLTSNNKTDILDLCHSIKNKTTSPTQFFTDKAGNCKALIHWFAHPIFSLNDNYLTDIQQQFDLSKEIVEQEYNLSFTSSNTLVFTPNLIYKASVLSKEEITSKSDYYMGLDTASVGSDFTVLTVLKWLDNKAFLVDYYRKNHESSQINIIKIVEFIERYNPRAIGIETNGIGQIYLEQLKTIVTANFQEIRVTQDLKESLITRLILGFEKEALLLPKKSPYTNELLSFKKDGVKYEAITGKNDDCVMSLAFALSVTPFKPFTGKAFINLSQYD